MHRSALNAVRASVLLDLLFGVMFGMLYVLLSGELSDARGGLLFGLLFWTIGGWFYGGAAVSKHYLLRLLVALHRLLPLRLIPFMDAMRDRILVQRAGAHYRFIHRTFQEHVAALTDERIEQLTR